MLAFVTVCAALGGASNLSAYPVSLTQGHISGTITFTADFAPTSMKVYAGNPLTEPTRYEAQVAAVLTNTVTNGTQVTTTWSYDITVEAQATTHYYLMPVARFDSSTPFVDENIPFPDYPLNNAAPIVVSPGASPGTTYDITYQPVILQGTLAATDLSNNSLPPRSLFINAVDSTPETIQPNCTGSIDQCISLPQSITALANYEVYLKPGRSYQLNSQAFTLTENQLGNGAYESIEFNDGDVVDATSIPPGGTITNNYAFHEIAELTGTLGLQVPNGWTVYNSGATITGTTTEGKPFYQEFFPPSFLQATGYIARLFNFVDLTQPISIAPNYQLSPDGTTALYFPNQAVGNINPGQNTFNLGQQAGVLNGKFSFFPPYRVTNTYPEIQIESSALGSAIEPFTPDAVNGGSYSLLASQGTWPYWRFGWIFDMGDPNFTSSYAINNWLQLASPQINSVNDVITNNFVFNTALLKVYFTAPTASTLSDPELDATTQDTSGMLYETGHSEGLNQNNVTTGEVRQVLRVSDPSSPVPFLVNPSAIVNGSRVTFGPFTVTPYPGQIIVVGVPGNIQLTVTTPQPNATSANGQFTVTGFAGGTQINSITINGQQVAFSPAATPADPNRVSFSAPITIAAGPIVVTATGLDNAQVTDTVPVTVLNNQTPAVTFTGAPPVAVYGTMFTVAATTNAPTTATITASGACSINGLVVTMTSGTGTCMLQANWPAAGNYTSATASQTTQAAKATPTITWTPASPLPYGVPLGSAQLDAVASTAGAYVYSPAAGALLPMGTQTLNVFFTPADTTDYNDATASVQIQVVAGTGQFVAFSSCRTVIGEGANVMTGDVGANESGDKDHDNDEDDHRCGVRLHEGAMVAGPTSRVVGDRVRLDKHSSIVNLVDNSLINHGGTVLGAQTSPVALPFMTMPAFPTITPGSQNIQVNYGATQTLAAGKYGHVRVANHGTLVLSGGLYQIASLDLEGGATVMFHAATEVRVASDVDADGQVKLILDPAVTGLTAAQVVIYAASSDDGCHHNFDGSPTIVEIGPGSTVQANIYAPQGTVKLGPNTTATGAYFGRRVKVGAGSTLNLAFGIQ